MLIFWMNFARGTAAAVAPGLQEHVVFIGIIAGIMGFVAGGFLGEPIRILRFRKTLTSHSISESAK